MGLVWHVQETPSGAKETRGKKIVLLDLTISLSGEILTFQVGGQKVVERHSHAGAGFEFF